MAWGENFGSKKWEEGTLSGCHHLGWWIEELRSERYNFSMRIFDGGICLIPKLEYILSAHTFRSFVKRVIIFLGFRFIEILDIYTIQEFLNKTIYKYKKKIHWTDFDYVIVILTKLVFDRWWLYHLHTGLLTCQCFLCGHGHSKNNRRNKIIRIDWSKSAQSELIII